MFQLSINLGRVHSILMVWECKVYSCPGLRDLLLVIAHTVLYDYPALLLPADMFTPVIIVLSLKKKLDLCSFWYRLLSQHYHVLILSLKAGTHFRTPRHIVGQPGKWCTFVRAWLYSFPLHQECCSSHDHDVQRSVFILGGVFPSSFYDAIARFPQFVPFPKVTMLAFFVQITIPQNNPH